jgi:hypothetical protein
MELFIALFNNLKKATPQILIGLTIATGVLLFSTIQFIEKIGLINFTTKNHNYIGIIFIISISILLSQLLWWIKDKFINYIKYRKVEKNRIKSLEELTADEKAYLIPYIIEKKNTIKYSIEDGIAQGLSAKKILFRPSSVGDMIDGFAYNLQPWARRYLEMNQNLLDNAGQKPLSPRKQLGLW